MSPWSATLYQVPPPTVQARPEVRRRRRSWGRRALLVGSVALMVGGGAIGWRVYSFYRHSAVAGAKLERQVESSIIQARRLPSICASAASADPMMTEGGMSGASTPSLPSATALVKIPVLSVEAPVVDGTDDPQLAVAVGRDPSSAAPGQPGTMVLAAHDVTWFSGISGLSNGDSVEIETQCHTYIYDVTGHAVVPRGSPVYSSTSGAPGLVLVTCWPTDALFLTTQRYLVFAQLVQTQSNSGTLDAPPVPSVSLTIPLAGPLASQDLTPDGNNAPLGELSFTGAPSPSWRQSPASLETESAALTEFFATLRAAAQHQPSWLSPLAAPRGPDLWAGTIPLHGATITHYWSAVDISLNVIGTSVQSVTIETKVALAGGPAPGLYALNATEANESGSLLITGWSMNSY